MILSAVFTAATTPAAAATATPAAAAAATPAAAAPAETKMNLRW